MTATPTFTHASRDATEEVAAMGELEISGNVTPPVWYRKLRTPAKKTDFVACSILAEIVYWYRPNPDGTRRFSGALLQKSYQELAHTLGCNKHQVVDAIIRLEKAGLIRRDFRTVETRTGVANNVLYIQIFPEAIAKLSDEMRAPLSTNPSGPIDESIATPRSIHRDKYREHIGEHTLKAEQHKDPLPGLLSSSPDTDFHRTREVIESAFGGQSMSQEEVRALERQVRKGRCCPVWAGGFRKAKKIFDANRIAYKGKAFIPVAPRYLSPNFDKVHEAVHSILAERCTALQRRMGPEMTADRAKRAFEYAEDFLQRKGFINLVGIDFMNLPACVRIAFAYLKDLPELPLLRQTLLDFAQRELRRSPDALSAIGIGAAELQTVFDLDQAELYQANEAAAIRAQAEIDDIDAFFEIYSKDSYE